MATVGVFKADAICNGALSFVMKRSSAPMTAALAMRPVFPARLTPSQDILSKISSTRRASCAEPVKKTLTPRSFTRRSARSANRCASQHLSPFLAPGWMPTRISAPPPLQRVSSAAFSPSLPGIRPQSTLSTAAPKNLTMSRWYSTLCLIPSNGTAWVRKKPPPPTL